MSLKMISFLFVVLISSQVRCDSPEYCEDIKTNGTFTGLQIYRFFEGINPQKGTIRLYNYENDFVVELRDRFLKFIIKHRLNETVKHKFSLYHIKDEVYYRGFYNCRILREKDDLGDQGFLCAVPKRRLTFRLTISNEAVIIIPIQMKSKHVLVFDRKDTQKWYSVGVDYYYRCYTDQYRDLGVCQIPRFIQQLDDRYFTQMGGTLTIQMGDKLGAVMLFNIDGRPKYCFTSEEKLSEECQSSTKMNNLFEECFDTLQTTLSEVSEPITDSTTPVQSSELTDDSTHPSQTPTPTADSINRWLIIFIIFVIFIVVIGVVWFAYYKCGPKKQDSTEVTED